MSFFNKVFASIGIGSAKVDARLETDEVKVGGLVKGIVLISGGNVEQKIDEIYLTVMTNYIKESDDKKYYQNAPVVRVKINEPLVIQASETKEIPFSFNLPFDTPISIGKSKIWLQTGLDIKNAVDPSDKDVLKVLPSGLMNETLEAIKSLGFQIRKVENESAPRYLRKRLPFIQEFEFYPSSGPFRGKLDELEVIFHQEDHEHAELFLQVDRRARGLSSFLSEAFEMDETNIRIRISKNEGNIEEKLYKTISRYS